MTAKEELEQMLAKNPQLKEMFDLLDEQITKTFYEWYDDSIDRGGKKLSLNQQVRYQECFKYGYVRGAIMFADPEEKKAITQGIPIKDRFTILDIREE